MIITIPNSDFNFEEVVVRKANDFIRVNLAVNNITHGYQNGLETIQTRLSSLFWDLPNNNHRLILVREFIIHISKIKGKYNEDLLRTLPSDENNRGIRLNVLHVSNNRFDDFQFYLYNLLTQIDYNLDTNAFSFEETNDLNSKLDLIIFAIDELKAVDEVLFNEFEETKSEIKTDFESLKSQTILGKDNYFKLALGKVKSYAGNKIADGILEAIKPNLIAFFLLQKPHLVEAFHQIFLIGSSS